MSFEQINKLVEKIIDRAKHDWGLQINKSLKQNTSTDEIISSEIYRITGSPYNTQTLSQDIDFYLEYNTIKKILKGKIMLIEDIKNRSFSEQIMIFCSEDQNQTFLHYLYTIKFAGDKMKEIDYNDRERKSMLSLNYEEFKNQRTLF